MHPPAPLRSICFLLSAVVALTACHSSTDPERPQVDGVRVLFIGNSLTYTNDLPSMVAELGRVNGVAIVTTSVALGGTALVDHLTMGPAVGEIARGGWNAVVMQQGPTPAGICRDTLVLATRAFATRIRAVGATPATLMSWPASTRRADFPEVYQSALSASTAVQGLFLPAGQAWLNAWRDAPQLALYGPDGFHPGPLGTYLAALVVFEGVTGVDARRLSPVARVNDGFTIVPEATVRLMQRAAHDALTPSAPGIQAADVTTVPATPALVSGTPAVRITC